MLIAYPDNIHTISFVLRFQQVSHWSGRYIVTQSDQGWKQCATATGWILL